MKTLSKIILAGAAIFMTNIVIAQGKSPAHSKNRTVVSTSTNTNSGKTVREGARVNGSINANANATQTAKDNANENSVLNGGTGTTRVKTKTRTSGEVDDNNEVVKVKSNNRKDKVKKAKKTR